MLYGVLYRSAMQVETPELVFFTASADLLQSRRSLLHSLFLQFAKVHFFLSAIAGRRPTFTRSPIVLTLFNTRYFFRPSFTHFHLPINFIRSIFGPSWPSKFSKEKLTLTRLDSSSAHPKPVYEGTPTDYCKDQAVFDAGAVPFRFGS